MRYYRLDLSRADGTATYFKSLNRVCTSLAPTGPQNPQQGIADPGALNIELDIPMAHGSDPSGNAMIRVWGLGLQDLGNAADYNNLEIAFYAGMSKGLPLANPAQSGLIMSGKVLAAIGHWEGTSQYLDMFFTADGFVPGVIGNFPFSWPAGTTLAAAIKQTLAIAMPSYQTQININSNLVLDHDEVGHYSSFNDFAAFIKGYSQGVSGDLNYPGVSLGTNGQTVMAWDNTASTKPQTQISFQDLIGQPAWLDYNVISIKTVMRADVHLGDIISLPPTLASNTAGTPKAASGSIKSKLTFSGAYQVTDVHHFGNFRQPDGASWATVFQAAPYIAPAPAAPTPSLPEVVET